MPDVERSYFLSWDFLRGGLSHPYDLRSECREFRTCEGKYWLGCRAKNSFLPNSSARMVLSEVLADITRGVKNEPVNFIQFKRSDILARLGWAVSGKNYKRLERSLQALASMEIVGYKNFSRFSLLSWSQRRSTLTVELSEEFLSELKRLVSDGSGYVIIPLTIERQITSVKARRLFEFLMAFDLRLSGSQVKVGRSKLILLLKPAKEFPADLARTINAAISEINDAYGYERFKYSEANGTYFFHKYDRKSFQLSYDLVDVKGCLPAAIVDVLPHEMPVEPRLAFLFEDYIDKLGERFVVLTLAEFNFANARNPFGLLASDHFEEKLERVLRKYELGQVTRYSKEELREDVVKVKKYLSGEKDSCEHIDMQQFYANEDVDANAELDSEEQCNPENPLIPVEDVTGVFSGLEKMSFEERKRTVSLLFAEYNAEYKGFYHDVCEVGVALRAWDGFDIVYEWGKLAVGHDRLEFIEQAVAMFKESGGFRSSVEGATYKEHVGLLLKPHVLEALNWDQLEEYDYIYALKKQRDLPSRFDEK